MTALALKQLEQHEWPDAMSIAARAFLNEPFISDLFGADLLDRFVATRAFYLSTPWTPGDLRLGAYINGELVGLVVASPSGGCHMCKAPDDPTADVPPDESEWLRRAHHVHLQQPEHARVGRMVVEPALQGAGIGSQLLDAALQWLRDSATTLVVLESEANRERFYLNHGFTRVAVITDDDGHLASYLMSRELRAD